MSLYFVAVFQGGDGGSRRREENGDEECKNDRR